MKLRSLGLVVLMAMIGATADGAEGERVRSGTSRGEAGMVSYVQPLPDGGQIVAVSAAAGSEPVWARDGSALFFRDGVRMMAASIQSGETLTVGSPRELFQADYLQDPVGLGLRNYDVAEDGRFLMLRGGSAITEMDVVLNWTRELLDRVPAE